MCIRDSTISFLSNVFREVLTFLLVPVLAGRNVYTAIAPAGATAMDTTLPLLSKYTDSKTAILAFVSGVISVSYTHLDVYKRQGKKSCFSWYAVQRN